MKSLFTLLFTINLFFFKAQNNLRLFSGEGLSFNLIAFDTVINKQPQTDVLIQHIYDDTIRLKIKLADDIIYTTTLYLFEKGKPTKNKEFTYRVSRKLNNVKITFNTLYDIVKPPIAIVPVKPKADTTLKYKNTRLENFCELKDGKPTYFNNIPNNGKCLSAMPTEYINYTKILMKKAQVPNDKYQIAENVSRNNCLSVAQLNFLLEYIDFEVEKLKLIKTTYYNLIDKENKKELEKNFKYEASKNELNNFIKTSSDFKPISGINCKYTSSVEAIKSLENNLVAHNNDTDRLENFKKLYEAFCYSTEDIKLILKLFIHDREKLEAAKLFYNYCVNKDNFLTIAEVFSYNNSVSELENFIAKQKKQ